VVKSTANRGLVECPINAITYGMTKTNGHAPQAKKQGPPPKWAQRLAMAFEASSFESQIELARQLNVSQQAISSWMNGEREPNLEMFERLARELAVRVEWLTFGVGSPDRDSPSPAKIKNDSKKMNTSAA
jgi:DNA-binding XRE family transcriptional regulator